MKFEILTTCLICLQLASIAKSGEPDVVMDLIPAATDKSWEVDVSVYGFLSGIDGTVQAGGHTADMEFDFGDIFEQLDFAFMIAASATYENKFTLLTDFEYIGISSDAAATGPLYDRAEVKLDQVIFNLVGAWRVLDSPKGFVEVGGGIRYMWVDSRVELSDAAGVFPQLNSSNESNIFDGIVAVRASYQLSPKCSLAFYGDIGGGGSDLTWQVWGGIGYQLTENNTAFLGYRHLFYDLGEGGVDLDISLSGPQIGLVHRF